MRLKYSRPMPTSPTAVRGMSLIEVLISVLILGIGMLGVAAMQAAALHNSQGSMQQSQAVIEANAMLDMIRANPTGSYALAMAAAPCTAPTAGAALDSKDKNWWITQMQADMGPAACGSVSNVGQVYTVTVTWPASADPVTVVSRL